MTDSRGATFQKSKSYYSKEQFKTDDKLTIEELGQMAKSSVPDRKISIIVNTLIGSGFQLVNVNSKPSYLLLRATRTDEFGIRQPYVVAYSGDNTIGASGIAGLKKVAANDKAPLVIIGSAETSDMTLPVLTLDQFVGRMGGSIPAFLPLEVAYPAQLTELGFNKRPAGLQGRADELFESYVHAGLQFIIQQRVIRYGARSSVRNRAGRSNFGKELVLLTAKSCDFYSGQSE